MNAPHTAGPWRWEVNMAHKTLHLVGGKPMFDLTIIEPSRWGMNKATLLIRDTAHDGMNILHKLHERADWWGPFPGRKHHTSWCAAVKHPDMQLIESAPDLLAALRRLIAALDAHTTIHATDGDDVARMLEYAQAEGAARAAIAKAEGRS